MTAPAHPPQCRVCTTENGMVLDSWIDAEPLVRRYAGALRSRFPELTVTVEPVPPTCTGRPVPSPALWAIP